MKEKWGCKVGEQQLTSGNDNEGIKYGNIKWESKEMRKRGLRMLSEMNKGYYDSQMNNKSSARIFIKINIIF
jgi:hypothetical protein